LKKLKPVHSTYTSKRENPQPRNLTGSFPYSLFRLKIDKILKSVFTPLLLTCIAAALMIIYTKECKDGVIEGIKFCAYILVPSLFPFAVLSSFVVESGIISFIEPFLHKTMKAFFDLPGVCGAVFFLCLIGGYPIGAKSISSLYRQNKISLEDAQKISCSAVCAGPGFLITFVGFGLYHNKNIGMILYVSQILSVLLLGIFIGRISIYQRNKTKKTALKSNSFIEPDIPKETAPFLISEAKTTVSEALVRGTADGTSAMTLMCGMVILFSSFTRILDAALINFPWANTLTSALLEITAACSCLSGSFPIEFIAFLIGWGGFCVHFQIFSFLKDIHLSKIKFFMCRLIQGLITWGLTKFLLLIFPYAVSTFLTNPYTFKPNYGGIGGSAGMIFTAVCFLYSLTQKPVLHKIYKHSHKHSHT